MAEVFFYNKTFLWFPPYLISIVWILKLYVLQNISSYKVITCKKIQLASYLQMIISV